MEADFGEVFLAVGVGREVVIRRRVLNARRVRDLPGEDTGQTCDVPYSSMKLTFVVSVMLPSSSSVESTSAGQFPAMPAVGA